MSSYPLRKKLATSFFKLFRISNALLYYLYSKRLTQMPSLLDTNCSLTPYRHRNRQN